MFVALHARNQKPGMVADKKTKTWERNKEVAPLRSAPRKDSKVLPSWLHPGSSCGVIVFLSLKMVNALSQVPRTRGRKSWGGRGGFICSAMTMRYSVSLDGMLDVSATSSHCSIWSVYYRVYAIHEENNEQGYAWHSEGDVHLISFFLVFCQLKLERDHVDLCRGKRKEERAGMRCCIGISDQKREMIFVRMEDFNSLSYNTRFIIAHFQRHTTVQLCWLIFDWRRFPKGMNDLGNNSSLSTSRGIRTQGELSFWSMPGYIHTERDSKEGRMEGRKEGRKEGCGCLFNHLRVPEWLYRWSAAGMCSHHIWQVNFHGRGINLVSLEGRMERKMSSWEDVGAREGMGLLCCSCCKVTYPRLEYRTYCCLFVWTYSKFMRLLRCE